jgi:hypothetical protein
MLQGHWKAVVCQQWLIQDFKLGGGGALKKIAPSRGRHEIVGVFRVKNHDFTPKNHIFFNFRGGGAIAGCPPPTPLRGGAPGDSLYVPWFGIYTRSHVKVVHQLKIHKKTSCFYFLVQYTRKCINLTHLSHKPIKLCVIYPKWKKTYIRNQTQRSRDHIKEKVASWPLKPNRTTA